MAGRPVDGDVPVVTQRAVLPGRHEDVEESRQVLRKCDGCLDITEGVEISRRILRQMSGCRKE